MQTMSAYWHQLIGLMGLYPFWAKALYSFTIVLMLVSAGILVLAWRPDRDAATDAAPETPDASR